MATHVQSAAAPLPDRSAEWLAALRLTLIACGACVPVAWLLPAARTWLSLFVTTLWLRGPIGSWLPVGLEPVLMEYGARHPLWLVVLVTAAASAVAESISYRVMRGVASLRVLDRHRESMRSSRVVRLFEKQPGLAVAFGALSPVPDWITRSLAAVAGYSPTRYVLADTIGRVPKLAIVAAAGSLLTLDHTLVVRFLLVQAVLVGALAVWRGRRARRRSRAQACPAPVDTVAADTVALPLRASGAAA